MSTDLRGTLTDITAREEAAARWLHRSLDGYWGWMDAVDDARDLLAALDSPAPDWSDVRAAARAAGWTHLYGGLVTHWRVKLPDGTTDTSRGWVNVYPENRRVELTGPGSGDRFQRSYTDLRDATPAQVLTAARLVGLVRDGDTDER